MSKQWKPCDSAPLGTTRNLTEVFVLLRNNAQQNNMYINAGFNRRGVSEEKMSLVALEEGGEHEDSSTQPLWVHTTDEVEFEFNKIHSRLEELASAQQKHISRPNFGDAQFEAEEKRMEAITEQVTTMLTHCQRLINLASSQSSRGESGADKRLRANVVSSLIYTLSNITNDFRQRQSRYLKDIKSRTKNVDNFLLTGGSDEMHWGELIDLGEGSTSTGGASASSGSELTMDQLQHMMLNESLVKEREKEVVAVNSSIRELNSLFRDVSSMVVDQGTILDRIDYNIEQSSIKVARAVADVHKAERYQRGDKKMHCICCLSVSIVFVLLLILLTKF